MFNYNFIHWAQYISVPDFKNKIGMLKLIKQAATNKQP